MEAPNPSVKAAEVEPKQSNSQMSILPAVQLVNVVGNAEEEEDELAEDDDVVMADVATGSSAVPSQPRPQSTRSAPRADEETTTAAAAPASAVPNPTQTAPATSAPAKKAHKPRAPKPEKSMMTSFKVRPPKEGTVNPVMSTTAPSVSSGQVQLNVPAPVPTTEAGASKSAKSTPAPKGQMKKRSRREEPNDPNIQVFYHDDAAAPATVAEKNEYPSEAVPSLVPPAPPQTRPPSKQRATQPEQPTESFSIPVADPLDLNGKPPKAWTTSYRTIQTISGATFGARVWKSDGVKAEPLKPPPNWILAPIYPTSSAAAQAGSAADKAAGNGGTGAGTPTGAPVKRGRKSKAELAVLATAAAADGTLTPGGKKPKAPKKPKKEKAGKKTALVVEEPGSGAVTPSVQPEDVEMASAS